MQLSKSLFKLETLVLLAILVLGFAVRLYRFNGPVADWHSWRQADTSAVSRNFASKGFDILHPRFEDLSNVASGLDNPNGYRFVEFPIYNVAQSGLFKIFGGFTIEEWGRLVTIFSSLLSSVFLYVVIKKRFGSLAGILSAFFFLFLPFNIYYSRTILPDPSMVMATLGSIYFFDKWLREDIKFRIYNLRFIASLLFMVAALLLKPYAAFFALPIVYMAFEKFGWKLVLKWQLWLFMIISFIPLGLWRLWMQQYPSGIPANAWLFNGNHIRFRPSFFYWLGYQRLTVLILGFSGVLLLLASFIRRYKREELFFVGSFALGAIIYVSTIATGNVQHDYYQILVIPAISIFLGLGAEEIIKRGEKIKKYLGFSLFAVLAILALGIGWNQIRFYFDINNPSIIVAGQAVNKLTPQKAKVIAPYDGDTSFLYQTKRNGWASFEKPLPELVTMGADYLVLVNPQPADYNIGKTYKIVSSSKDYILFNLHEKP